MNSRLRQLALWFGALVVITCVVVASTYLSDEEDWPPPVKKTDAEKVPVLSPEQALESFSLPPGFHMEVVAAEPLVQDPIAMDIDPDGRLWVVEMRGYMTDIIESAGDYQKRGQIVVLEDENGDGRMDRKTVFLDSLVLPRSVLVTGDGVLVGEPPRLWLARDTDGDLKADQKTALREDYGDRMSNPESLPSDLVWGMDNWVHTTHYPGRFRRTKDGTWQHDSTLALGQWGLSMDNHGRFLRMWNADPLRLALLDPNYYTRNPDLVEADGADVSIASEATEVWPIHTTEGVNRGYREAVLRENQTLTTFTAASGGAVYRGDRYPQAFQGDVFVPEPAGNLIRRFKLIEQGNGSVKAVNAYDQAEFMASTDERFRPVNMTSAPDGTLYVVDMYRGIIQHRNFLSQYLKDYARRKGLEAPIGLGRIYRIVYEPNPPRKERPQLTSASSAELVEHLTSPNGWWRDTAQQLLVERNATEAAPALREMVRSGESELARLHALWTLEGLGALTFETVRHALEDTAAPVRAAAVRVAEPWLKDDPANALPPVAALAQDPAPPVRLQLAASLGEVPPPAADSAMVALLSHASEQPYLVDAVVSGLDGRELTFLRRLVRADDWQTQQAGYPQALQTLAATIINAGRPDQINQMLELVGDQADLSQWQRLALLDGIETLLPDVRGDIKQPLELREEPAALARVVQASDSTVRRRAQQLADRLVWPGKPGYTPTETTLITAAAKQRFKEGKQHYQRVCATCHRADGTGQKGLAKTLVGSEWVLGQRKDLARIVLDGKEGSLGVMPPHRSQLSNEEIAAILTYIRNAWGNEASPVAPPRVEDVRQATATRGAPWTDQELRIIDH